jgi:hypothetical protein
VLSQIPQIHAKNFHLHQPITLRACLLLLTTPVLAKKSTLYTKINTTDAGEDMSLKSHKFASNLLSKSLFKSFIPTTLTILCGLTFTDALVLSVNSEMSQKSSDKLLISQSIDEEINLKFESRGCYRNKSKKVICDVLVTNLSNTRPKIQLSATNVYPPLTNAIDSSGTVYVTNEIIAGGSSIRNSVNIQFPPAIPTKVSFIFEIPPQVTELTALDVGYLHWIGRASTVPKQIALTNIGTIASQPNTSRVTNGSNNGNCTCPNNSGSARTNSRKK